MPFDGITIRSLTNELNSWLTDARINSIHQPERDELLLSIRHPHSGTYKLLISANARWARMHISTYKKANPQTPPSFCMLLRKYLEGGKIKSIHQEAFERIVHIEIEALDDFREWKTKLLICEFMGKHSNIILVNPETGIIIDAIKKYGSDVSSYREVFPGREYISPPSQDKLNPLHLNYDHFVQKMWAQGGQKTLSAALFNSCSGISPFSSREICTFAGLSPDMPVDECAEYEFNTVYRTLEKLLQDTVQGDSKAAVLYNQNQPAEFTPYPPSEGKYSLYDSINEACDLFYSKKMESLRLESMKTSLSKNIKVLLDKAYKKRFYQEGDIKQAQENEKYRQWGELLTAYAHEYKKGDRTAVLNDFYTGEEVTIDLDPRYNPVQNAQKHFKVYNKSRKTIKHLETLMAQNQLEIDYLESVLVSIHQAENPALIEEIVEELEKGHYVKSRSRKRESRTISAPRRFISSDGLEILVGRNNRQNDLLTLKTAERTDLWLHTKNIPGTHVIVRLPRAISSIHDLPDATLEEAASLAAYYSKAAESEKVEVDYTFRAQVKKPAGALPGMVIYDNYWTVVVNPQDPRVQRLVESEIKA